jgi:hypothetical protein
LVCLFCCSRWQWQPFMAMIIAVIKCCFICSPLFLLMWSFNVSSWTRPRRLSHRPICILVCAMTWRELAVFFLSLDCVRNLCHMQLVVTCSSKSPGKKMFIEEVAYWLVFFQFWVGGRDWNSGFVVVCWCWPVRVMSNRGE